MAIVLGTDDPVFSNGKQTTAPKPIPAPAPAPAPAAVYDYPQYTDPYTAIPDSQGYASPVPGVVDATPYWVDDPGYVGSGGGYTLDPKTGLVWIDPLNRWGTLTELQNAFYGAGTGAYGESVSPAGYVPPPEPSAVQKAADSAAQFVAAPYDYALPNYTAPQPDPLVINNQVTKMVLPWEPDPTMQNPDTQVPYSPVDMTPSSRVLPNITQGNWVWDSTLQAWVDKTGGYIWNPITDKPQTRAQYLDFITRGTSAQRSPWEKITDNPLFSDIKIGSTDIPSWAEDVTGPFGKSISDYVELSDKNKQGRFTTNDDWVEMARSLDTVINTGQNAYQTSNIDPFNLPGTYVEDLPPTRGWEFPNLYDAKKKAATDLLHLSIVGDDGIRREYFRLPDGSVVPFSNLQDIPGILEYVRGPDGQVIYEKNAVGELVPMTKDLMSGKELLAEGLAAIQTAVTMSPYQLDEFDSIRAKLPKWVNDSIEGSTSLLGVATTLVPFAGVGGVGATMGLNIAQNFLYGAAYAAALKAGAPKPLAVAIAFIAAGGAEWAAGKGTAIREVTGDTSLRWLPDTESSFFDSTTGVLRQDTLPVSGPLYEPGIRAARATAKEFVDKDAALKGKAVSLTDSTGYEIRGIDLGSGVTPSIRKIQLPNGSIVETNESLLFYDVVTPPSVAKVAVDPVEKSADEVAKNVNEFTTSRGSSYTIDPDGITTRMQAKDTTHPGGPQPKSTFTIYLDPTDSRKLMDVWVSEGTIFYVVNKEKNQLAAVYNSGPNKGKLVPGSEVPYKSTPEVGLSPMETWLNANNDGQYSVHFGTEIVSLSKKVEDLVTPGTVVKETPTPDGGVIQEIYDPVTSAVHAASSDSLEAAKENPASLTELTRPKSLAKGDEVMLGDSQGIDYLDQTRYVVDEAIDELTPMNSVRLVNPADGTTRTVLATRVWKAADAIPDNTILLHAGVSPAEVVESLSKVSAIPGAIMARTTDRIFIRHIPDATAPYQGVIHTLPKRENFGAEFVIEDVFRAEKSARKAEPALLEVLHTQARASISKLGRIDKEGFLLDVQPSTWERANLPGIQHPMFADVLQHPDRYVLTPEMKEGIADLASITGLLEKDNEFWGVIQASKVSVDTSGSYWHRAVREVVEPETGRIIRLAKKGMPSQKRLSVSTSVARQWPTAAEAYYKGGVRFVEPIRAFDIDASTKLRNSRTSWFLNTLAENFGRTVMDDPAVKRAAAGKKEAAASVAKLLRKVDRLEQRQGISDAQIDELERSLKQWGQAMPSSPSRAMKSLETFINRGYKRVEDLSNRAGNPKLAPEVRGADAIEWHKEISKEITAQRRSLSEGITQLTNRAELSGTDKAQAEAAIKRLQDFEKKVDILDKQIKDAKSRLTDITTEAGKARSGYGQEAKRLRRDIASFTKQMGLEDNMVRDVQNAMDKAAASGVKTANLAADVQIRGDNLPFMAKELSAAELNLFIERLEKALPDDFQKMAFLDTAMRRAQKRLANLRLTSSEMATEIDDAFDELGNAEGLLEKWTAIYKGAQINAGPAIDEAGVPMMIAPKLASVIFDASDAEKIKKYIKYLPGSAITNDQTMNSALAVVHAMNQTSVAALTTADGSVRMSLLDPYMLYMGVRHPVIAAKTFGVTVTDAVVRAFALNRKQLLGDFFTDPRTIAAIREGKVTFRTAGDPSLEFIATRAIQRVPGVRTLFNAAEHDFSMTWNYAVRELYFHELKSMQAQGKVLDNVAKEMVGRAVTRLAGVSFRDPSPILERELMFAARYFYSAIELHVKAFTDRSLEGDLARKHLMTVYGTAATLSGAVAIAQGRPLQEVLSPFEGPVSDPKAWTDGRVRWNSNWLSVRVNGIDVPLLGAYKSLGRVIWVTTQLPVMIAAAAARGEEFDPTLFVKTMSTLIDSRGSPVLRLFNDAVRGRTYSNAPLFSWESVAERFTPITWQNVLEDVKKVQDGKMTWGQLAQNAMLSFLGASSNPMTDYERRNVLIPDALTWTDAERKEYLLNRDGPLVYSNLSTRGRQVIDAKLGKVESTNWTSKERAKRKEEIQREYDAGMQQNDRKFLNNEISSASWDEQRKLLYGIREGKMGMLYYDYEPTVDPRDPVARYLDMMEKFTDADQRLDYDRLEAWAQSNLTATERKYVENFFNATTSSKSPVDKLRQEMLQVMDDVNFYDVQATTFQKWAEQNGVSGFDNVQEWKKSLVDAVVADQMKGQKFANKDQENSYRLFYETKAWEDLNNNDLVKAWGDEWYDSFVRDFIIAHPDAAIVADVLGNLSIREDEANAIKNASPAELEDIFKQMAKDKELTQQFGLTDPDFEQTAWSNFEFKSDAGVTKLASYEETRNAWRDDYATAKYGKTYDQLGQAQKDVVGTEWGKITDDNGWSAANHRTSILGVLDGWDSASSLGQTEEYKRIYLANITKNWTLDEWDLLEQANIARGGDLDWLLKDRPTRAASRPKALSKVYEDVGMKPTDLLPK